MKGSRNQMIARAGRLFVAAVLNRRGAYAVTFAGNGPKIEVLASNLDRSRTIHIQVKTRSAGPWQSSIDRGRQTVENLDETTFWVLVDLSRDDKPPEYYVVPTWWMASNIYATHQKYLALHGGVRPDNPDSKHHSTETVRIAEWKGRWDLLRIL